MAIMKILFTALIAALAVASSVAIDNAAAIAAAETNANANAIPQANFHNEAGFVNDLDATGSGFSGNNGLRGRRELWGYGGNFYGSNSQSGGFATGQLGGGVAGNRGFFAGSQNSLSSSPGTFSNNGNQFNAAFSAGNGFGQVGGNFQSGAQSRSSAFNQGFRQNRWW